MQTTLDPYISFRGNTRDAMQFYQTVFGGKLEMNTFKDFHASQEPGDDDLIMHAMLEADGIHFMAADTPLRMDYTGGTNISMTLSGDNHAELQAYFEKLAEGGSIREALVQAPWGDTFGMCVDKFGIVWMVNIAGPKA